MRLITMKRFLILLIAVSLSTSLFAQKNDHLTFRAGPLQSFLETDPMTMEPAFCHYDIQGLDMRIQYGHDFSRHFSWILSMTYSDGAIYDREVGQTGTLLQFEDIAMISGVDYHYQFGKHHRVGFSTQAGLQYFFFRHSIHRPSNEYPGYQITVCLEDVYCLGMSFESAIYYQYSVTNRCAIGLYGMLQYQTSFKIGPRTFAGSFGVCTTIKL